MRPIFTVHAGEYIVGNHIETHYPGLRVWVPSKDDGVDLLVTDKDHRKLATLQVKFSKDHLATGRDRNATQAVKSGGWWSLNPEKIAQSTADYWVLVLCQFTSRSYDFVIIRPKELARRYQKIAPDAKTIQSYFWVTQGKAPECWETRGLSKATLAQVCDGSFKDETRRFTGFLNRWPFGEA